MRVLSEDAHVELRVLDDPHTDFLAVVGVCLGCGAWLFWRNFTAVVQLGGFEAGEAAALTQADRAIVDRHRCAVIEREG